jgi:hypothetical protein
MVFVGIDWSEKHHDVEVLAESGQRLKSLRIAHGVEGLAQLQQTLAEQAEEPAQLGLLVNALVASGYAVYRSTLGWLPVIESATRSPVPSPTSAMPRCSPILCVRIVTGIGR